MRARRQAGADLPEHSKFISWKMDTLFKFCTRTVTFANLPVSERFKLAWDRVKWRLGINQKGERGRTRKARDSVTRRHALGRTRLCSHSPLPDVWSFL